MATAVIILGHDIKQEWVDVVVKRFGAEEDFGEEAEVLAVDWIFATINFEDGNRLVAIYLISGGMFGGAL